MGKWKDYVVLILDKGPLEKIFFVCWTVSLWIINKVQNPFWCMLQMRRRMILMGNQTNFSSTLNLVDLLNLKVLYSQHLVSWKRNWVICKQISALRFRMMFSLLVDFMIRYGLNCVCILYMSARTKDSEHHLPQFHIDLWRQFNWWTINLKDFPFSLC